MIRFTLFDLSIFGGDDSAETVTAAYAFEPRSVAVVAFTGRSEGSSSPALTEPAAGHGMVFGAGSSIGAPPTSWASVEEGDRIYTGHEMGISGRYMSFGASGAFAGSAAQTAEMFGRHERQPSNAQVHEAASTVSFAGASQPEIDLTGGLLADQDVEFHPRLGVETSFTGAAILFPKSGQVASCIGTAFTLQGYCKREPGADLAHNAGCDLSFGGAYQATADRVAREGVTGADMALSGWSEEGLAGGLGNDRFEASMAFGGTLAPAVDYWGDESGELVTDEAGDPIPA